MPEAPATPAGPRRPERIVLLALAVEGGLGVLACGLGWAFELPLWAWLRPSFKALAWGLAASLPLFALMWVMLHVSWGPLLRFRQLVDTLIVPLFSDSSVADLAGISVLAGFGEELLFRGVLVGWIDALYGPWWAVAVASAIFGLAHSISTVYFLLATFMGAYLGWLWIASGSLLAPIVTHSTYDFIALVYLVRRHRGGSHVTPHS